MLAPPRGGARSAGPRSAWVGETFDGQWNCALPVGGCLHLRPAAPSGSRILVLVLSVVPTAFVLVLPVELPDKTLFASLVLATRFPPLPVFVGVGAAFGLQVAIAVTAGFLLTLLPEALVSGVVAALFLVGAVLLWRSASSGPEDGDAPPTARRARRSCARPPSPSASCSPPSGATSPSWPPPGWPPATRRRCRCSSVRGRRCSWSPALAVFLGKKLADRLPIALIRRVAAGLFLVFAVVAVVETVRALT